MLIYYTILTLKYSTLKNNFHCALSTEIIIFYFNHDFMMTEHEHNTFDSKNKVSVRNIERKLVPPIVVNFAKTTPTYS